MDDPMKFSLHQLFVAVLGGIALMALTGCGTPETANKSERPWNSPKSWENGLPSGINEGR